MTQLFELAAGVLVTLLALTFWPFVILGAFMLTMLLVSVSPEVANTGRSLALLGIFGAVWVWSKLRETY